MTRIFIIIITFFMLVSCKEGGYKNGKYKGGLPADYEGYKTETSISISNGKIKSIEFSIIDTNRNVKFDGNYEKYMDNDYYKKQCREDWAGLNEYLKYLKNGRDIKDIESISGATWSFNKLKSTINSTIQTTGK